MTADQHSPESHPPTQCQWCNRAVPVVRCAMFWQIDDHTRYRNDDKPCPGTGVVVGRVTE